MKFSFSQCKLLVTVCSLLVIANINNEIVAMDKYNGNSQANISSRQHIIDGCISTLNDMLNATNSDNRYNECFPEVKIHLNRIKNCVINYLQQEDNEDDYRRNMKCLSPLIMQYIYIIEKYIKNNNISEDPKINPFRNINQIVLDNLQELRDRVLELDAKRYCINFF